MKRFLDPLQRIVILSLIVMMGIVVVLATLELGWVIIRDMTSPPFVVLEVPQLLDIFGLFLLVLIGIELLDTTRAYLEEHVVHVQVVIEVALIALARKVIILDLKEYSPVTLIGVAALIIALAAAYYIERRTRLDSAIAARPRDDRTSSA